jgi:lipoprotein-releasing system permease protein
MYKYFLACKYLLSRWINLLCVFGVSVAVWALVLFGAVFSGFVRDARNLTRGPTPDLSVMVAQPSLSFWEVDALISEDPDVAATAPRLAWFGMLHTGRSQPAMINTREKASDSDDFIKILGIDPEREYQVSGLGDWIKRAAPESERSSLDMSSPFQLDDLTIEERFGGDRSLAPEDGILMGWRRFHRERLRGGLDLGSRIVFTSGRTIPAEDPTQSDVAPIKLAFRTARIFRTPNFRGHERSTIYVDIDVLRPAFGQDPEDEDFQDIFNEISIKLKPGANLDAVKNRLDAIVQKRFPGAHVFTWEDRKQDFLAAIDQEQSMIRIILFVLMVVACFLIFATMHMMVTEKTKDIGVLSALGATRGGILWVFMTCGMAIGLVGTSWGLLWGLVWIASRNLIDHYLTSYLGVQLFPYELFGLTEIPSQIEPAWIVSVCTGTFLAALIFSAFPALRAARMEPAQTLRYE